MIDVPNNYVGIRCRPTDEEGYVAVTLTLALYYVNEAEERVDAYVFEDLPCGICRIERVTDMVKEVVKKIMEDLHAHKLTDLPELKRTKPKPPEVM